MLEINNIKQFKGSQDKAFEKLCYQICQEEYNGAGQLVPVDDSGGGDGVEFYLRLENGDIWGWQCKFFDRFSESGRKEQIKKSLHTAYCKHGNSLKRWFLCSKADLTPEERSWFEKELAVSTHKGHSVLPSNHGIELVHWGESVLSTFMAKYPYIDKYFFDSRVLTWEWIESKSKAVLESSAIRDKYNETLHISGDVEERLVCLLGGELFAEYIKRLSVNLDFDKFTKDYSFTLSQIERYLSNGRLVEYKEGIESYLKFLNKHREIISLGRYVITDIIHSHQQGKYIDVGSFEKYRKTALKYYRLIQEYCDRPFLNKIFIYENNDPLGREKSELCRLLRTPLDHIMDLERDNFFDVFKRAIDYNKNIALISGHAGRGKTHLGANFFQKQIDQQKPAIFIAAKRFHTKESLNNQILSQLDIPQDWAFDDFLTALDVMGRIYSTKSVLIIEGLNEAIEWRTIYKDSLEGLILKIKNNHPNILLIVTYRTSFEDGLFNERFLREELFHQRYWVEGFEENTADAIMKYLEFYEIKLTNYNDHLNDFNDPLFLRIFCELNAGKTLSYTRNSLFEIFDQYVEKCNKSIIENLGKELRYNRKYLSGILNTISKDLWEGNISETLISNYYPDFLNENELRAIDGEHLLLVRDYSSEGDSITFVYDLLGGYLIAKHIHSLYPTKESLIEYINSEHSSKLLDHPLYNDITRCFCILTLQKYGCIFEQICDSQFQDYIASAIYETDPNYYKEDIDTVKSELNACFHTNGTAFLKISENTWLDVTHPLNFKFTSSILLNMGVAERDLLWSEYIRRDYNLEKLIEGFENACVNQEKIGGRIHVAALRIMWILTSTNRYIRDLATRALYYYGRRFSQAFLEIIEYSLTVNDPYVPERVLAAAYGIALCSKGGMPNKPDIVAFTKHGAKLLCRYLFDKTPLYKTTHITIKEYGLLFIKAAIELDMEILPEDQKNRLNLSTLDHDIPAIHPHGEKWSFLGSPMQMDFSNYTIGYLSSGWHSYSDPKKKQDARGMIFTRIYDLGWSIDKFQKIEDSIGYYSTNRSERVKVERYGKKYSWIGYFEVAGLLYGRGKIALNEWEWELDSIRYMSPDIDPTFPKRSEINSHIVHDNFFDDMDSERVDWIENGNGVDLSKYRIVNSIIASDKDFVLIDGYYSDKSDDGREIFAFYRTLIVDEDKFDVIFRLLRGQSMEGRWLPDLKENHYSFADELFFWDQASQSNIVELNFPQKPQVLLPVCKYSYECDSKIIDANYFHTISKEIINSMGLLNMPQTFEIYDSHMQQASFSSSYGEEWRNRQSLTYLRKDILDAFLTKEKKKMIEITWGERELIIASTFFGSKSFQSVIEYVD